LIATLKTIANVHAVDVSDYSFTCTL